MQSVPRRYRRQLALEINAAAEIQELFDDGAAGGPVGVGFGGGGGEPH